MALDIEIGRVLSVYFIAIRIGVLLILTPIFSNLSGLVTVRILLTLAFAVALEAGSGLQIAVPMVGIAQVVVGTLAELIVGGVLAFGVFAAFGAFSVAGKVLDIQSGFGIGSVFDPVTRASAPLFSTMFNLLAVAVFFALDGHHVLLRGIAFSVQQVPPGSGFKALSESPVIAQFGLMFSLGVALIAPVMVCLFLVEAGLGVVSRVLPQMNVFTVAVPIKIFSALALLAMTVGSLGDAMQRIYASIFLYWEQVLL